jgi:hypothetical protein
MKDSAPTLIWCQTADPAKSWHAHAPDRRQAEMLYMHAVATGQMRPPVVRVIAQLKVDQHDAPAAILSEARH